MMVQLVPVSVRNSNNGKMWYARALTHDASGRGDSPEKALNSLENVVKKQFGAESIELVVRSVDVSFPTAKSIQEFVDWMNSLDKATSDVA